MHDINIIPIPFYQDNYAWLIFNAADQQNAVIVDPGHGMSVIDFLQKKMPMLKNLTILNTHQHDDHVGGNKLLKQSYAQSQILVPKGIEHCVPGFEPNVDRVLLDQEKIITQFHTENLEIIFLSTPGHTSHDGCFWIPSIKALFCGDLLFSFGCGRVFSGTMRQLWNSLQQIKLLPADTQIYCGHEYTLANLRFAQTQDIVTLPKIQAPRLQQQITLPTLLSNELVENPFLVAANFADFEHLRLARNNFGANI